MKDFLSRNIMNNGEEWFCFYSGNIPNTENTILMRNENCDIPPWTGYYDIDNNRFIAYETRLPISVTHWKEI